MRIHWCTLRKCVSILKKIPICHYYVLKLLLTNKSGVNEYLTTPTIVLYEGLIRHVCIRRCKFVPFLRIWVLS